jgi:hypothetical protein
MFDRTVRGYEGQMSLRHALTRVRSFVVVNLLVSWLWRHREEFQAWIRSVPLLVHRLRKRGSSASLTEVRSVMGRARSVDHQRWATRSSQLRVRDRLLSMSKRGNAKSGSSEDEVHDPLELAAEQVRSTDKSFAS